MLCQSLLYNKVTQSYTCIHSFFLYFLYDLSQDIEYSSLCYTVGPCLSILNATVYSTNPKLLVHPSFPPPLPLGIAAFKYPSLASLQTHIPG